MQNSFTSGSVDSVVDPHPHHLHADPDLTYHPDADPDSDFYDADPCYQNDADPSGSGSTTLTSANGKG